MKASKLQTYQFLKCHSKNLLIVYNSQQTNSITWRIKRAVNLLDLTCVPNAEQLNLNIPKIFDILLFTILLLTLISNTILCIFLNTTFTLHLLHMVEYTCKYLTQKLLRKIQWARLKCTE